MDPRVIGAYALADAGRYLSLPLATVRSWVRGRPYPTSGGRRHSTPLICLPSGDEPLLSFTNLVEAHVLAAIRRHHGVPMNKVRSALDYLEKQLRVSHPLAHAQLLTDGVSLFMDRFGELVNLSASGQLAIREILAAHLQRIEHDADGLALRLFPFSRGPRLDGPRIVVVDPRVAFGRPVIAGTGIRTDVVVSRHKAGESIAELAADYSIDLTQVEEAIRFFELAA